MLLAISLVLLALCAGKDVLADDWNNVFQKAGLALSFLYCRGND